MSECDYCSTVESTVNADTPGAFWTSDGWDGEGYWEAWDRCFMCGGDLPEDSDGWCDTCRSNCTCRVLKEDTKEEAP